MARYVAVPVDVAKNGNDGYLAWVDCDIAIDPATYIYSPPLYGHGSTEDEAFADLVAKLGYREAVTVNADNHDMMTFFATCVGEYDSDSVADGLRKFISECRKVQGEGDADA